MRGERIIGHMHTSRHMGAITDADWDSLCARLARSRFRSRFKLGARESGYLQEKGGEIIRSHALDFINRRLAPREPRNDGRQTPMRGHPVFIAQHATATCCRGCLEKWHGIGKGRELGANEIEYVVSVIMRWIAADAPLESHG